MVIFLTYEKVVEYILNIPKFTTKNEPGHTKEFLKREWKNALEEKVTPNCRKQCAGCGAAIYGGGVCFES